jgi:hypothetical protein
MADDWKQATQCPYCGIPSDAPKITRRPNAKIAEVQCRHCRKKHFIDRDKPGAVILVRLADLAPWAAEQVYRQSDDLLPEAQLPKP